MRRKATADGRLIYLSHNDFGHIRFVEGEPSPINNICPKIADFGQAQRGDVDEPRIMPIQADPFRAPEVILGTGWSYSADIYNLGAMVSASSMSNNSADLLGLVHAW